MVIENTVQHSFAAHLRVIKLVREEFAEPIEKIGQLLAQSLTNGGTLFWCGNGGSAADSQHLAAELVGRFKGNRRALRSIALTTDASILTCVANDFSYDDIFARQIEGLGRKGDVLIGISTSGNSKNVLRAFKAAKEMGLITVALLGKGGGAVKDSADHALVIPSGDTARIQEVHILIGHILCEVIEQEMGLA